MTAPLGCRRLVIDAREHRGRLVWWGSLTRLWLGAVELSDVVR
jgi:hypothetical protein